MNAYKLLKIAEGSDRSVSLGNRVVAWAMRRLFFVLQGSIMGREVTPKRLQMERPLVASSAANQ